MAGTFNVQNVANRLWSCNDGADARGGADAGAGGAGRGDGGHDSHNVTFAAQNVANMLWAYATMARAPGAGRMQGLEGRAEAVAGTFAGGGKDAVGVCNDGGRPGRG